MEVGNSVSKISNSSTEVYRSQPTAQTSKRRIHTENMTNMGQGTVVGRDNGVYTIPEDMAKSIITEINKKISKNTTAQFSYHEKTNRIMIKIMDSETNEVIKEIPPEKTLDMIAQILELAGILVDDKR